MSPKDHVASFGFGTWHMRTHGRVVLELSSSWDGFINRLADRILCEAWKRQLGRPFFFIAAATTSAPSPPPDGGAGVLAPGTQH
ncbi:MAG: hypothetical protein Q9180_004306 [Flavoplaca navasiana]